MHTPNPASARGTNAPKIRRERESLLMSRLRDMRELREEDGDDAPHRIYTRRSISKSWKLWQDLTGKRFLDRGL